MDRWKGEINYLDLFSGIGGFSEGIRQALSENKSYNRTDDESATSQHSGCPFHWHGFSEIDKYATSVYKRHFPDAIELGSITAIDPGTLPKIDLVTFGFPCQDLSIAGKRRGLDGKRSGLFFEAIRIIDKVRPDYFVFENVKGLLSSNDGKDFEVVLRTIADIGYDGQWQLLNTSWFLPQNRERIYFVGYPRGASRPEVFPIGEGCSDIDEGTGQSADRVRNVVGLDANYFKGADGKRTMIATDRQTDRQ